MYLKGSYISGSESWIKITAPIAGQPRPTNNQDFMMERQRKAYLGFLGYEDAHVTLSPASKENVSCIWVYEPFIIRLFVEKEQVSEHRCVLCILTKGGNPGCVVERMEEWWQSLRCGLDGFKVSSPRMRGSTPPF